MTVNDVLDKTHDYQDFYLIIRSFGTCRKLYDEYLPNGSDLKNYKTLNKFLGKRVAEVKFGNEYLCLILKPGEEND